MSHIDYRRARNRPSEPIRPYAQGTIGARPSFARLLDAAESRKARAELRGRKNPPGAKLRTFSWQREGDDQ